MIHFRRNQPTARGIIGTMIVLLLIALHWFPDSLYAATEGAVYGQGPTDAALAFGTTRDLFLPLVSTPAVISPPDCPVLPDGSFLTIWAQDPDLQVLLGCPISYHPRITPTAWPVQSAYQPFEQGMMIWSDQIGWYPQPVVYVLYANGTYRRFEDHFNPAVDPVSGGETPPPGLVEPVLGFGKVWREQPEVREALGWATSSEMPGEGRFQTFSGGDMVWMSQTNQTYVFVFADRSVHVFDIQTATPIATPMTATPVATPTATPIRHCRV